MSDGQLPDPEELFRRMREQEDAPESEAPSLPDPAALFEQMSAEERPSLPDPAALFEQMSAEQEEEQEPASSLPDPAQLFAQMKAEEPEPPREPLPNPAELFEQMHSQPEPEFQDDGGETLLDSAELFRKLRGVSLDDDKPEQPAMRKIDIGASEEPAEPAETLPSPAELFRQMQEEPEEQPASSGSGELSLLRPAKEPDPDPAELFRQMQAEPQAEPAAPDPAELFRQMQSEQAPDAGTEVTERLPDPAQLFRQTESPPPDSGPPSITSFRELEEEAVAPAPEAASLPALPDLEAFKAELEAEERANLDDDLLGDLSGPERLANTVSDQAFMGSISFADVPEEVAPSSLPQPVAQPVPEPEPDFEIPKSKPPAPKPPAPKPAARSRPPEPEPEPVSAPEPKAKPHQTGTVRVDHSPPPSAVPKRAYKPSKRSASAATSGAAKSGGGLRFHTPKPAKRGSSGGSGTPAAQHRVQAKQEGGATLAGKGLKLPGFLKPKVKIDRHSLCIFTRQLSAMIHAGIPLHLAVSFCAESDPDMAPVLDDIVKKIEGGYSFSAALKEYPDSFDAVFVGLVNAGELSGRLNEMLSRLADVLERELELRKRLISVITYPAVLLGVSLAGTMGFILFILPTLTPLFMDLEVDLPLPTQILLGFRQIMVPLFIVIAIAAVAMFMAKDSIKAYIRSQPLLERRIAAFQFGIPILGGVYEKIVTARILYALSTMLDVGVTMAQALSRTEASCGNAFMAYRLERSRLDLCDGNSISDCFRINEVFPPTALHLIAAGEESAQLTKMFAYIASHFDEDVENSLDAAASLLEPLIMVFMGGIVGFIVVAAALPTIKLLQAF